MSKFGAKESHRSGMSATNKEPPAHKSGEIIFTFSEEIDDVDIIWAKVELDCGIVLPRILLCKGRDMVRSIISRGKVTKNFSSAHITVLKKTGTAILNNKTKKPKKNCVMTRDDLMVKIKSLNEPVDVKDIDFRVQSVTKTGLAIILAYKDARYDMNMLDEKVGPENWARDHRIIGDNLYCGIGIRIPADVQNGSVMSPPEWVWKWDVGTESQTEATKGQASDSFKRAGFNWGIGRELYDFPFICIQLNKEEFFTKDVNNGGYKKTIGMATNKFRIKNLKWEIDRDEDGKITSLIAKQGGTKRFEHNDSIKTAQKKEAVNQAAKKVEKTTPAPKATTAPPKAAPEKKEEPKIDTAVAAAIQKVKMCKTEATLKKYWAKDFREFQGIPEFKSAVVEKTKEVKGK